MVGTKKKNGKTVPNCVPKESVVSELTDKEREKIARIRDKKASARDADGRSSVKRQQKKKDAAANPKKAAAPKPVKSKPKLHMTIRQTYIQSSNFERLLIPKVYTHRYSIKVRPARLVLTTLITY